MKAKMYAFWLGSNSKDLGGLIFIDLRDRSGIVQVVFNPGQKNSFKKLIKSEMSML